MNNKLSCNLEQRPPRTRLFSAFLTAFLCVIGIVVAIAPRASAADAPAWMHALVNAPLPPYDEKTNAILLYSEDVLNVQANGKIKSIERRAYKILRPDGRVHGIVRVFFDPETRITGIHGWCIPAQGKDYEVKDKDATETGYSDVDNGELVTDLRTKTLHIPAPDPG